MKRIVSLNEHDCRNVSFVGGKAISLSHLISHKFVVPNGFVVTAQSFIDHLERSHASTLLEAVHGQSNHINIRDINILSKEISKRILTTPLDNSLGIEILEKLGGLSYQSVAVRSSATVEDSDSHSWAGQLQSFLCTPNSSVLDAVKKCWASFYSPRSIFYRTSMKKNLDQSAVAVIIQEMVLSEKAGVCFTRHPIKKDSNKIVIEAAYGLGEAVVKGSITPDTYIIDKKSLTIEYKRIGEQAQRFVKSGGTLRKVKVPLKIQNIQKITDDQIIKLSLICMKIENLYGSCQDIEWSCVGNKFHILQSRPITI